MRQSEGITCLMPSHVNMYERKIADDEGGVKRTGGLKHAVVGGLMALSGVYLGARARAHTHTHHTTHTHTPGVAAFAIVATWVNTCVLVTGGQAKCWGFNDYGQLGIGSTVQQNSPVDVVLGAGGHRGQACDVRPK
jgi:hypothetical protein